MISEKIKNLSAQAIGDTAELFKEIDEISQTNTEKVLSAFQRHRVSETCFHGTTGYGYNDKGREVMNLIFSDIMGTTCAVSSGGFVSGTHAITCALFASLRHGQTLLSATGKPYDTLHNVIGIRKKQRGSLEDSGISYAEIDLRGDGCADIKAIEEAVRTQKVGAVFVQRSRGYATRRALSVCEIGEICDAVHKVNKDVVVVVDNCYGEFVEEIEPGEVGVDIIAGSHIKNPGGGLMTRGGYVAGREDLVEAAANRLTVPGIGIECGAAPEGHRLMYQGLFMAPHTVSQALKTAVFAARLFELLGYRTNPKYTDKRSDIIQMLELGSPELLQRFCSGIQAAAPVDSFVTPIPSDMPGYEHPVIMAAGTFVQGASIELSADAPMREPYNVFLQGGLTFEAGKHSIMIAASGLM
ncbi:MAG: methionine gamma-lyase family protein [Oscillospiraceae bacterium]|nr:methionine gamma-lyase family protein [Oscillospiraceae bacterium]